MSRKLTQVYSIKNALQQTSRIVYTSKSTGKISIICTLNNQSLTLTIQIQPNHAMHLSKIPCVLALASTVLAGQCYNHNEGAHKQKCVHKDKLAKFAEGYCHDHWSKLNGDWTDFNDRSGNTAKIGKVANFSTKKACIAVFFQIVANCYDGWDGGQWAADGVLLNINFCRWTSEAKRVGYEGLLPPHDVKSVRYEGLSPPADARRVRYEGLPPSPGTKRVAYQRLRVGVDL